MEHQNEKKIQYPSRNKTKNELVAQGDAFLDQKISKMIPDLYLKPNERMTYVQKLKAVGELLPYSKIFTKENVGPLDETKSPVFSDAIPASIAKTAKEHWAEYVNFLREEKKETIAFRKNCLEVYENRFKEVTKPILEQINAIPGAIALEVGYEARQKVAQIPEHIATGTRGHVFKIEVEGTPYIMKKFFGDPRYLPVFVESDQVLAHQRSEGVPHVQQLVAYSHDDHTLILSFMSGKELGSFSSQELGSFPKKHLKEIVDTCISLSDRGLLVDYHYDGGNFLYDKEEGMNFIDPTLSYQGENWSKWIDNVRRALSVRFTGGEKIVDNKISSVTGKDIISILEEYYPDRLKGHPEVVRDLSKMM